MSTAAPTAAVISIGDEVLRGDTPDSNMGFLCAELYKRGVLVKLGLTLPDELSVIVSRLREIAPQYDHVLVGGGIGPTPDDLTRQAVAEAFGRELSYNEEALREYELRRGTELNAGQREMCRLPAGCGLIWGEGVHAPGFYVENVYCFPGVPRILRAMWDYIAPRFSGPPVHVARFLAYTGESRWAHVMADYVARYPELAFGSYPKMEGDWFAEVTVRGYDAELVARAAAEFEAAIGAV